MRSTPDAGAPKKRRPWIRLSLRGLIVLVMLVGLGMGRYVRSVQTQRNAVAAILRAGGTVSYDWEWDHYNPDIINPNGRPRAPKWLAARLGVDYVGYVVHVNLIPQRAKSRTKANDQTLAHVGRLGHLVSLELNGAAITDAGLIHLKSLTRLRDLNLGNTVTSDAGLVHLKSLTELRGLRLAASRVTYDGVLALERAIPGIRITRDEDFQVYPNRQRAIDDLGFAQSQPIRVACELLVHRARFTASHQDWSELTATVKALCTLEADDQISLLKLAEARAQCIGILSPYFAPKLPTSDRQALQRQCTDRAIDALTLAVEKGYDNVLRVEGDYRMSGSLGSLRDHPDYPKLIAKMKRNQAAR
ncbi:hypothetical protein SAMN05444166_6390 [Singulisphaera sp. GP187]|uniref:hypothetical protein n=1 Tax=Singulisphaera sp. GP187 TaxID=1882752 RepID=UPI00092A8D6D|nr:hypothetical protein [Singulisphaera sp. GP187]SIO60432.1 hypothetical protein SAMN05444166_6390 [Singulisphaera sp. GP187]